MKYTLENANEIFIGDQQIINVVLQGKIKQLPTTWNVQVYNFASRLDYTNNPKIIHYVGKQKPWIKGSFNYFREKYYKYLSLTPWSESFSFSDRIEAVWKWFLHKPTFFLSPMFFYAIFRKVIK